MAVRVSEVLLDVQDVEAMTAFWSGVLELPAERDDDGTTAFRLGADLLLVLLPVPEPKTVKNRLHLDLTPVGSDQATELARLQALGARRADVGQGDDVSWVVLADPEGNEFCLLRGG